MARAAAALVGCLTVACVALAPQGDASADTPADTCTAATPEMGPLPFDTSDTTAGQIDDYDLPPTVTNPTCGAPTSCTGDGPLASLPRGAVFTGTGVGPDRAYRIGVSQRCTLDISAGPTTSWDLALIVYDSQCSSDLADCACVDDTGVDGSPESIRLDAVAGQTYFIVIDGYSAGAAAPGPSGPYTLTIVEATATGCALVDPLATTTSTSTSTITSTSASTITTTTVSGGSGTTSPSVDPCAIEPVTPTFRSIACRLDALAARVNGEVPAGDLQARLAALVAVARERLVEAADRCRESSARRARGRLRGAIRRLGRVGPLLRSRAARALPPNVRDGIAGSGFGLAVDLRTRRGELDCPADVGAVERKI